MVNAKSFFLTLSFAGLLAGLDAVDVFAKNEPVCPDSPTGHALLQAADRVDLIAPIQFLKVEKTSAGPQVWKFKSAAVLKPESVDPRGLFSFFAKADDTEHVELKLNDRFVLFSKNKDIDFAGTMKSWLLQPDKQTADFCVMKSNVYLEEFIKRGASVEAARDNSCRIQVKNLETNPLIKDALSFRCQNRDLEKRRITQLAEAYAKAKRYGNAVVALELANGNLNANTLSKSLTWANEWQTKDDRAARRFVERLLTDERREHFQKTRQISAMKDILEDKKNLKNLRDTDWFPDLTKRWIDGDNAK